MRSTILAVLLIFAVMHSPRADDGCDLAPQDKAVALEAPFDEATARAAQSAWAKHISKPGATEINSIEMEMVLIPPGTFSMGSPSGETGRAIDENQVLVTLTQLFYLGKTEVTQRQWLALMGTTPWKGKPYVKEGDQYPATYVSWDDAKSFCTKLSEKEGAAYRLPTDAEWEFACRAGTTTQFSFGNDADELSLYAWWGLTLGNGATKDVQYAHEVGRMRPNPFGLSDVHGNVWEWCQDVYVDKLPGGFNPLSTTGSTYRVYRGGGWNDPAAACRSANRNRFQPTYRNYYLGFRVARSSPVQ